MSNINSHFQERTFYRDTVYLLTGIDATTAERAVLSGDVSGISAMMVGQQFRKLLSQPPDKLGYFQDSGDAAVLRHDLDWLLSFSRCYARVRLVLEADDAAVWFLQANRHLDGRTPLFYLGTRTGERHLQNYLHNLLNGNFA